MSKTILRWLWNTGFASKAKVFWPFFNASIVHEDFCNVHFAMATISSNLWKLAFVIANWSNHRLQIIGASMFPSILCTRSFILSTWICEYFCRREKTHSGFLTLIPFTYWNFNGIPTFLLLKCFKFVIISSLKLMVLKRALELQSARTSLRIFFLSITL